MASLIDYEDLECENCGNSGLIPNGDFAVICPECGHEASLIQED